MTQAVIRWVHELFGLGIARYEVTVVWDNLLYVHHAESFAEALEWAGCYAHIPNARARIWRGRRLHSA